ncbi:hypothetical protein [Endozoicomonas euniceicola]|uniref:Uncharacterized protein n=1 Tax=Endozoicomonas euniceicola TaxID=1234143 RepID=A0ABY6GYN9_9GAMM|nr:hypothetical protein [Endozoicomonas euniceicola]UYM17790.1 hypothetical protein NX720_07735 [Endozoicomonas euniceicola]
MIEKNHPGLATPEFQAKAENLRFEVDHLKPSSISDAQLKNLQQSVKTLGDAAASPTLDADKLDQIMSEIQTKMDENSVKFSQFEIQSRSDNAQQTYDKNIEGIEQYIKDVEEAKASQSSGGGWLSGIITAIFPIFEIAAQITKAVDPDTDFSLFSRNSSIGRAIGQAEKDVEEFFAPMGDKQAWDNLGKDLKQDFNKLGHDIEKAFEPMGKKEAWENLGDDVKQDFEKLGKDIEKAFEPIGKKEAWENLGNDVKQDFEKLGRDIEKAFEPMGKKEAWENLGDDVKQDFEKLGKDIEKAFEPIGEKEAWENLGDDVKQDFEELGTDIEKAFEPMGKKEAWDNLGDDILNDLGIEPSSGKPVESATVAEDSSLAVEKEKIKIEKELGAAMQGLDVGESALTSQEMMKLLQKMKDAEENKEKLEEAIAALESGDLESLKQAVAGLSEGDAIISLIDNPETASAGLVNSLLDVPAETAKIHEDQMLQNSMAKRFS